MIASLCQQCLFHEHTQISIDERNTFFRKSKVRCGINFADDRGPQFVRSTVYDKQNAKQVFSCDPSADTYNEFRRVMAETVESAVIEQDIEVNLES